MKDDAKPEQIPAALVMEVRRATGLGVMDCKQFLMAASPHYYARIVEAARTRSAIQLRLHDPLDDDPAYAEIMAQVEAQVAENLRDVPRKLGFCRRYWNEKQRILHEDYDLEWLTPAQMNPGSCFD